MRALVFEGSSFHLENVPDPVPEEGEILVAPYFNGICGSDLHTVEMLREYDQSAPPEQPRAKMILGHEFSSEVVGIGPNTQTDLKPGDLIVANCFVDGPPPLRHRVVGLDPALPGGMGELSKLDAVRTFKVPDGIDPSVAAVIEPLAVARHAVDRANRHSSPNMVIGCGPIGLGVILALRDQGRGPIIASDLSPERRAMAERLGADIVVDPTERSPFACLEEIGFEPELSTPLLPLGFTGYPRGLNIFECSGAKSMLDEIVMNAPRHSHVIYAAVCLHEVHHQPAYALISEMTVEYPLGYSQGSWQASIALTQKDPERVRQLISSIEPLPTAQRAFDRLLASPSEVKVLIDVRAA